MIYLSQNCKLTATASFWSYSRHNILSVNTRVTASCAATLEHEQTNNGAILWSIIHFLLSGPTSYDQLEPVFFLDEKISRSRVFQKALVSQMGSMPQMASDAKTHINEMTIHAVKNFSEKM